jgi:hypothetical protein
VNRVRWYLGWPFLTLAIILSRLTTYSSQFGLWIRFGRLEPK